MSAHATTLLRLVSPRAPDRDTDTALLDRFVHGRDEAAFAALVRRHGPMVRRVCRRVLADAGAADDAFQAAFCVLARKAATLRPPRALAAWLHGVAYRVALKARSAEARRRQHEAPAPGLDPLDPGPDPLAEVSARELLVVVDEEVQRLPEGYRLPVILCCLEGRTREEAAALLGWTAGAVKGRLERGRARLHARLVRRGLTLGAALAAVEVSRSVAASVPVPFARRIAEAALGFAADRPTAVSGTVATLAEEGMKGLAVSRQKVAAVLLVLGMGLAAAAAGALAHYEPAAAPPQDGQPTARDAGQPRTDRYGDPLPGGAVARIGTTRLRAGSADSTSSLVYTPDGKSLVACDAGKLIRVWDPATGKEQRRIEPPGGDGIFAFALAPDGKTLATAGLQSPVIRLWGVATGQELRQLAGDKTGTSCVGFSPDGKILAAAAMGTGTIQLWDVGTWQESQRLQGHTGWITSLLLLPDGKTLVSADILGNIRWWDMGTGREVRRRNLGVRTRFHLAASPDGKRLAAVLPPGVLFLWDAATGAEVSRTELGPESGLRCLCFSPDSQTLACGSGAVERGSHTRFLAASTGRELRRWEDDGGVRQLAFSPDGKTLAQGMLGRIRLCDAVTGAPVGTAPGLPHYVMAVRFAPDGQALLASCLGGPTASWDPITGGQRGPFRPPPEGFAGPADMLLRAALSADGRKAALADARGVLHVWEPASGKALCRVGDPPARANPRQPVRRDQADFSPDGKAVVVKHPDEVIRVWDTETGKLRVALPRFGQLRFPHPHAFSPDGRLLATAPGSLDRSVIRLWDAATGQARGELAWQDPSTPTCLAFAADGKSVVAALSDNSLGGRATDPSLRVWDLATGRQLRWSSLPPGEVRAMALSPDGRTLAVAAGETILLYELASGRERGRFPGHRDWVWALAFSPDGRLLASGSLDYTALVWDVTGLCPDGKWSAQDVPAEEVERLWAALAGTDGPRAHRAVWRLATASRQSVPFLAERLRPVSRVEDERLARLTTDLDSDQFAVRNRAQKELSQLGELAEPAVRRALAGQCSPEVRRRLEALLAEVEGRNWSPEQLRALRALEVLEHIGTADARRALHAMAEGAAGARLTREAKASLERLARRPVPDR
jgi:RNA polymerase sigma factor (sigma-70 family)